MTTPPSALQVGLHPPPLGFFMPSGVFGGNSSKHKHSSLAACDPLSNSHFKNMIKTMLQTKKEGNSYNELEN